MRVLVAGSAAGGGLPQWNCACRQCAFARLHELLRSHAAIAISGEAGAWYLVNATPDVRQQIAAFPALHPGPGLRETPIRGVLLTDAELDHTIGLLILREGSRLEILAPTCVLDALARDFPVREVLSHYAEHTWIALEPGEQARVSGLTVTPVVAGARRPRYAGQRDGAWVVAYRFEDRAGRALLYAPCVEGWSVELRAALDGVDCAFVDGTFWSEHELLLAGVGDRTATDMGHVPLSGPDGSADLLASTGARRIILTHVNNTNPILDRESVEVRAMLPRRLEVAEDGTELEL